MQLLPSLVLNCSEMALQYLSRTVQQCSCEPTEPAGLLLHSKPQTCSSLNGHTGSLSLRNWHMQPCYASYVDSHLVTFTCLDRFVRTDSCCQNFRMNIRSKVLAHSNTQFYKPKCPGTGVAEVRLQMSAGDPSVSRPLSQC